MTQPYTLYYTDLCIIIISVLHTVYVALLFTEMSEIPGLMRAGQVKATPHGHAAIMSVNKPTGWPANCIGGRPKLGAM